MIKDFIFWIYLLVLVLGIVVYAVLNKFDLSNYITSIYAVSGGLFQLFSTRMSLLAFRDDTQYLRLTYHLSAIAFGLLVISILFQNISFAS
jgi:hypothetical protein